MNQQHVKPTLNSKKVIQILTKKESSYPKLVANSVATDAVTLAIVLENQSSFGLSG